MDGEGNMVYDQRSIKKVERIHFANFFKDSNTSNICDQLDIIKRFPSFFSEADCQYISRAITMDEVETILKGFSKDKSLWPDA